MPPEALATVCSISSFVIVNFHCENDSSMQSQSPFGVWASLKEYVTVFCRMLNEWTLPSFIIAWTDIYTFLNILEFYHNKTLKPLYNGRLYALKYKNYKFVCLVNIWEVSNFFKIKLGIINRLNRLFS